MNLKLKHNFFLSLFLISLFFIPMISAQTDFINPTGGNCIYKEHLGVCTISSILKTEASKQQKDTAGYEGFEVKFNFVKNGVTNTNADQEYSFQLLNSWYPGPAYLDKYQFKLGNKFNCNLSIQIQGTCAPVTISLENVNSIDYFEAGNNKSRCLEVISGHNNLNDMERVNIIFVGFNYSNLEEFKTRVVGLININGDGSTYDSGLLAATPFRDYKNKFNLWYVNETRNFNLSNFSEDKKYLFDKCSLSLVNKQEITLIKGFGKSYANLGSQARGWTVIFDWQDNIHFVRNTLLHEFGHSFGGLLDEYSYGYVPEGSVPIRANCDVASKDVACAKWCSGKPLQVEELTSAVCDSAVDVESCIEKTTENLPCMWLGENEVLGQTGCINRVSLCTEINSKETCENSFSDFWNGNFCYWVNELDSYYKSNCIPGNSPVNIGTNCIENTGCYQGCTTNNWFRSSSQSRMRVASSPWLYINEKHLVENINSLNAGSKFTASSSEEVITFDEFDYQGNVLKGGIINLNNLTIESQENIIAGIEEKTQNKVSLTTAGKIEINNLNPVLLVEAYIQTSYGENNLTEKASITKISSIEEISSKAIETGEFKKINKIELKEESEMQVYSITGLKETKIFAIFPVSMNIEMKINAETKDILSVDKPWWSFFAL